MRGEPLGVIWATGQGDTTLRRARDGAPGITENYTYDPIYQLTQVTQGGSTTESYSYDPVGNRLSSLSVALYNYNASNQLTSDSLGSYTYDNNGNTLTDPSSRSFTWDFENRMVQAVNPGVGTTTFKYDPFGRRIQKAGPWNDELRLRRRECGRRSLLNRSIRCWLSAGGGH